MDKIFKVVKKDGAFFFTLAILNLPIILQAFVGNENFLPPAEKFFHYIKIFWCWASVLFVATVAIHFALEKKKKLKKFLQRLFIGIFSVTCAAEFFYLSKFRRDFDIDAVEIFLENLFAPAVLIGVIVFAILVVIGVQDLQKIFKAMSAKKIKRITYALLTVLIAAVFSLAI